MATEFLMPKLGLTMEEGTILAWLVPDGAEVRPGMPVMSIETDKVESDVEASGAGRLQQLGVPGDSFSCGAVVGMLLAPGEEAPASAAPAAGGRTAVLTLVADVPITTASSVAVATRADGRVFASPNARRIAAERGVDIDEVRGTGPEGRIVTADVEEAAARPKRPAVAAVATLRAAPMPTAAPARPGTAVPSTAAARQLADLLGVDLGAVEPDPVEQYVTRDAVARYVRARLQPAAAPAAHPHAPLTQQPVSVKRMTGMRGTIAKRMHQSLQQMAQLTLTMDADMDAVVDDRTARRAAGRAPGYTDYVVAAVSRALRKHPMINAQVTDEGIAVLPDVHVGLAVALDEGLLVPVVRHADRLTLDEISVETSRLADGARAGSLSLADLEGGTCSVTALGMFGVDAFTPVINPPNAAIVGVGRLREDLVLVDGQVVGTTRLTLSLTWDHRVVDGAPAAAFCREIVELLAQPAALHRSATTV